MSRVPDQDRDGEILVDGSDLEDYESEQSTAHRTESSNQKGLSVIGEDSIATLPEVRHVRQHRASVGKKVTARIMPHSPSLSSNQLNSQIPSLRLDLGSHVDEPSSQHTQQHNSHDIAHDNSFQPGRHSLFSQVLNWLQREKARPKHTASLAHSSTWLTDSASGESNAISIREDGRGSQMSQHSIALDELERILAQYSAATGISTHVSGLKGSSSSSLKRFPTFKGLRRGSISDSDYFEADSAVPSADVVLDNTKTLPGLSGSDADTTDASKQDHWLTFKSEILRLIHTLGLKGWKRVPLDAGGDIDVVRLSGALTNAVYVVSPPEHSSHQNSSSSATSFTSRRKPPKLLLRIYGPQVEHLIDRENELQVLRRLERQNIGPRMLGTFNNGRFEQYFNARPLTPNEMRSPETSKKIAKRMRELHDGIELLASEKDNGPYVWRNWDKWIDRCEAIMSWVDGEIASGCKGSKGASDSFRKRGFVCGFPWPKFRELVEMYRKWLDSCSGGPAAVRQRLVFAHNDAQYGNLLRLEPTNESPLLLPVNEHKQIIVIDFEYASANTRGLEFSNHFTEWCYDYRDMEKPWALHANRYPTVEEQICFIRAYLTHKPRPLPISDGPYSYSSSVASNAQTPSQTPMHRPTDISGSRVTPFTLDHDPMTAQGSFMEYEASERTLDLELQRLVRETRIWRAAGTAQWAAWGIVQATIPGLQEALSNTADDNEHSVNGNGSDAAANGSDTHSNSGVLTPKTSDSESTEVAEEGEDWFDYLAYAQDRALFFLADIYSLGLIKEEELPEDMLPRIKEHVVPY